VFKHGNRTALQIGIKDRPASGTVVTRLKFLGLPGKYYRDENTAFGILINGSQRSVIRDCVLRGCGNAIYDVGATYGTRIENCRILGWGSVAIGVNGGEQVLHCSLVQDDPNLRGQRSNHGIYVHSGSHDVLIQDTLIANARKSGCQIYGEAVGQTIERITFRRVTFKDCFGAFAIANFPGDASLARDILIEGCSFTGSYAGAAVLIKQGDRIRFRDNLIDGGSMGLGLGNWAPSERGWGLVTQLQADGNTIRHCGYGICALPSNGGRFVQCTLGPNRITNCQTAVYLPSRAGITLVP
jgi:Right handed beta helix region